MLGVLKKFGRNVLHLNVYCYVYVTQNYEIELIVLCELNRKTQEIKIKKNEVISIQKMLSSIKSNKNSIQFTN